MFSDHLSLIKMSVLAQMTLSLVFLGLFVFLILFNAIGLTVAYAEMSESGGTVSGNSQLNTAKEYLKWDMVFAWAIFIVGVVIISIIVGLAAFAAPEVAPLAFGAATEVGAGTSLAGGAEVAEGGLSFTKVKGKLRGAQGIVEKAGNWLNYTILALALFVGLLVAIEGSVAGIAARYLITSPSFTETGKLSTAYWWSFTVASVSIGAFALDILIIIVTFLSSRACPATQ